ncbi:hypothetical protein K438DRAFT_1817538 [Mycena galopus ATCC 62051]|nr:hypothetical protein K438DRAFT_1817538 [Mycena galopus ATCC 62051]
MYGADMVDSSRSLSGGLFLVGDAGTAIRVVVISVRPSASVRNPRCSRSSFLLHTKVVFMLVRVGLLRFMAVAMVQESF